MKAEVIVRLKKGVTDPEGSNVHKTLNLLGIDGIKNVKFSKLFEFELEDMDESKAQKVLEQACTLLLSNPVINDYKIILNRDI